MPPSSDNNALYSNSHRRTSYRRSYNFSSQGFSSTNIFRLHRNSIITSLQLMILLAIYFLVLLKPDDASSLVKNLTLESTGLQAQEINLNPLSNIHIHKERSSNKMKQDQSPSFQSISIDKKTLKRANRLDNLIMYNRNVQIEKYKHFQQEEKKRKERFKREHHFEEEIKETDNNNKKKELDKGETTKERKMSELHFKEFLRPKNLLIDTNDFLDYNLAKPNPDFQHNTNSTLSSTTITPSNKDNRKRGILYLVSFSFFLLILRLCTIMLYRHPQSRIIRRYHRNMIGFREHLSHTARQARINALIQRINQTRIQNGENPISPEVLRTILTRGQRDFNPNDYDHLLRYNEEAGPSEAILAANLGASSSEIDRCPSRFITNEMDDLMLLCSPVTNSISNLSSITPRQKRPKCAICLEHYTVGEHVRTIPCFHTFHSKCIDPWLKRKAECPICKFSAIG